MILLSNRAKFTNDSADYSLWNIQWEELSFESAENLILNTTSICTFYGVLWDIGRFNA